MRTTEILVGTDGSGPGTAAVHWAAREAHRRGTALRVVLAYDWNWPGARFGDTQELRELAHNAADATLSDAVIQAHDTVPGLAVHRDTLIGQPATVLLDAASRAALVVVGNRGHGGFASLLLGSVSQRVATHAPCPVVVVRGRSDAVDGPVVVGVDGSPASGDALALAFQLAGDRAADLVAIRAYLPPTPPWGAAVQPLIYDPDELHAAEHAALADALAPWRDKYRQVRVEELVGRGSAARVLVGVSHTAQLVVVGSRGHGGFAGSLLGSVGQQLLHHADCPVLIARTPVHA